jgi:steroid delta-isomerase-like uncharacterized protein
MSEVSIQVSAPVDVISAALTHLNRGQIEEVVACFAQKFTFKDHGIGLEFNDRQRLTEFFKKARELYPDSFLKTDRVFVSGNHVIAEWTLEVTIAELAEPIYAGLTRKVPISLPGTSIVRVDNGKIADWADYYDGLTARRTALAAHFTEWVEHSTALQ